MSATGHTRMLHTPGPWKISDEGYVGAGEYGIGPVVAKVAQFFGPGDRQRYEADRRLIAAAPEMLDALLAAEKDLATFEREIRGIAPEAKSRALRLIRAVLAKAVAHPTDDLGVTK